MRTPVRTTVVGTFVTSLLLASTVPAAALDVRVGAPQRVLGDLSHQEVQVRIDADRVARGQVLRFPEGSDQLDLRPRLGRSRVHGTQTTHSMAQADLSSGAVAGINGGYWINLRSGNPNGLSMLNSRLTTSNASSAAGHEHPRSAMGILPSGQLLLDQVRTEKTLTLPDTTTLDVRYMNRRVHASTDVTLYDDQFGDQVLIPRGGTAIWIDGLDVRPGRDHQHGTVTEVIRPSSDQERSIRPGQVAIVAHRDADIGTARDLRRGDPVSLGVRIVPTRGGSEWPSDLQGALPAGGTLLRGGQVPSLTEWRSEVFRDSHFTSRHPRTAIGRTSNGETLLVTIDGRQSGWSWGLTARELAQVMQELGARDAVNLDGGGSTTMTIGGEITNRPSESGRAVSSGLFVHTEPPPPARRIDQHACPADRVPSNAFRDVPRSSVHAPAVDCLAWWGVTRGTGPGTYDPSGSVTRAQMASFLARWLDGAASRGSGQSLPGSAQLTFRDVAAADTHAEAIARLARAGIVQGRDARTYLPTAPVTRDQMASFIRRAIEYSTGESLPRGRDTFVDDNGSVHEDSINRLAALGVASGVGGFDYRPRSNVRRDAMASLLMRGADHLVEAGTTTPPS